jgi:hypothetical protein
MARHLPVVAVNQEFVRRFLLRGSLRLALCGL